jgi:hypothetical protein
MKTSLQLDLTFEQLLSLVKQLSRKQKIELSKELEKEAISSKLSKILGDLKTEELDLNVVAEEVEHVRKNQYEKGKRKGDN